MRSFCIGVIWKSLAMAVRFGAARFWSACRNIAVTKRSRKVTCCHLHLLYIYICFFFELSIYARFKSMFTMFILTSKRFKGKMTENDFQELCLKASELIRSL